MLYDRQNFGAAMPEALRTFVNRVPLVDARFFVTAVLTQRDTGGNLSEVLERLADVMRVRVRINREVRTHSAHGRITAWVLGGITPLLALFLLLVAPDQMELLVRDPLGVQLLIGAVTLEVIGIFVVRKLVTIDY